MEDKNAKDSDLRVRKTRKALYSALFTLLQKKKFSNLTVYDICSEAHISRAAFYSHFRDKYDALSFMFSEIRVNIIKDVRIYGQLEKDVNGFIDLNKKMIYNVIIDANNETLAQLRVFMSDIVQLTVKRKSQDKDSPQHIILDNFFVGGLVNLLTWIVLNNYPQGITMVNEYLYKMMDVVTVWDAEQEFLESGGAE